MLAVIMNLLGDSEGRTTPIPRPAQGDFCLEVIENGKSVDRKSAAVDAILRSSWVSDGRDRAVGRISSQYILTDGQT